MTYTKYKIPFPFFNAFLISWKPNTISKIHDHGDKGCWMFMLKGRVREEIYSKTLKLKNVNYHNTFDRSYIDDNIGYHRIKNGCNQAYTLNIYHPKNTITKYYTY